MSNGIAIPSDAGWWLAGAIAVANGIRWLLGFVDRREKRRAERLDAEEDALDQGWSAYRRRMEARLASLEQRDTERQRQNYALRLAFEHVAGALIRFDPANPALRRAEQLLEQAFPIDLARDGAAEPHNALVDQLREKQ